MRGKIHYAWFILFISFIALLTVQGVRLSFGAFIPPWEQQFSVNREVISRIALISYIIYGISQPIIGKLIDSFGVRTIISVSTAIAGASTLATFFVTSPLQLFILYGVIASVGFGGASNVVFSVAIANWFQQKRGVALSVLASGIAAGQMLIVPISLVLIEDLGWQITVVVWGAFLSIVVFPMVMIWLRSFPAEKGWKAYGDTSGFPSSESTDHFTTANQKRKPSFSLVLKTKQFWFLLLPYFVCGISTTGLMDTHLIPFAHDHGFSTQTTGAAVSLLAAFNIIGTLLSGHIADRWSNRHFLALLYLVRAFAVLILLFVHQSFLLIVFAVLFGIVDFATVAPTSLLATEYFKTYSIGVIIGWLYLSHQIGSALGAYVPGLLYQLTGGYDLSFISTVILLLVASGLSYALPDPRKKILTAERMMIREG